MKAPEARALTAPKYFELFWHFWEPWEVAVERTYQEVLDEVQMFQWQAGGLVAERELITRWSERFPGT
ncbi:MAG: hypothetical protein M2R46_01422 [Verrucomicrobia subdivision 3 bacterium]|nr:hypothetical protein [Limisphaerales bacterium]